jgi:hypothetical protein
MLLQMEKTMKMQLEMGTAGAGESDEMKVCAYLHTRGLVRYYCSIN